MFLKDKNGIQKFDHIVTGYTIEENSVPWLGFLVDVEDYDTKEDYGADAIIEFGSEEEVRTLIKALKEELERENTQS